MLRKNDNASKSSMYILKSADRKKTPGKGYVSWELKHSDLELDFSTMHNPPTSQKKFLRKRS